MKTPPACFNWKNIFNGDKCRKGMNWSSVVKYLTDNTFYEYMLWNGRIYKLIPSKTTESSLMCCSAEDTGYTEDDLA